MEHGEGDRGYVEGRPFLYHPYKVIEIASHLLGDIFASEPSDDGRGIDFHKNLLTYSHPTNAFLHVIRGISFTAGNTNIAENMKCGAGQTLTFDETNFLMLNKDDDPGLMRHLYQPYVRIRTSIRSHT